MSIDPYVVGAVLMALILSLCVAIMFLVRDRQSVPAHVVRRTLRCSERRQTATVEFIERTHTGMTVRSVQSCSLWAARQRCRQDCRYHTAPEATERLAGSAEEEASCPNAPLQIDTPDHARPAEL